MRAEIYFRRVFLRRSLGMTFCAKFPRFGFRRCDASRAYFVLRRNRVTRRAADQSMGRSALDICDLRMTGGALSRSLRWHGVMGIVTGDTGLQWIMNDRIDLRKSRRPGLIVSVAEHAELSSPWRGRLLCRVFDVRNCGPMTGLTRDGLVITFRLLRHLVDVAGPANRRARECNFLRHFSLNRGFSMKTSVGQSRREDDVSYCDHQCDYDRDDNRESFYLFRNLF